MDLNRLSLFSMFGQRMGWLGERQRVLAENIANADTPGFAARDIKPFAAMLRKHAPRLALAQSDPVHATGGAGRAGGIGTDKVKPAEITISGNTVSLEREMMKAADTAMDYQLVTNLYRKQLGMFRAVLARGGG